MRDLDLNIEILHWKSACNGDKIAFGALMLSRYQPLFQYGTRISKDHDLIKDCIQDLFLDFWERKEAYASITSPKSYLFQALRNNLVRKTKKSKLQTDSETFNNLFSDYTDPETDLIYSETLDNTKSKMLQVLNQLPNRQKEALYLKYYENLTYEEIASIMGLKRQAVANYLHYGLSKLKILFTEQMVMRIVVVLCFEI